jgi:hypothetical protein
MPWAVPAYAGLLCEKAAMLSVTLSVYRFNEPTGQTINKFTTYNYRIEPSPTCDGNIIKLMYGTVPTEIPTVS